MIQQFNNGSGDQVLWSMIISKVTKCQVPEDSIHQRLVIQQRNQNDMHIWNSVCDSIQSPELPQKTLRRSNLLLPTGESILTFDAVPVFVYRRSICNPSCTNMCYIETRNIREAELSVL